MQVVSFVVLGFLLSVGAFIVLFVKDRSEETEDMFTSRLVGTLAESLRVRAPGNPTAQIMACRAILLERADEGIHASVYPKLLVEALGLNWPAVPKDFFQNAIHEVLLAEPAAA